MGKKRVVFISSVGFMIWLFTCAILPIGLIESLLLFAFFVTIPLFLYATANLKTNALSTWIVRLHLPMAVSGAYSFHFASGLTAGILSLGWGILTGLIGLQGILNMLRRGFRPIEEVSIDLGLVYLPLGSIWFMAHRFGLDVMDFDQTIVLLTAIHFHYSFLSAPVFTGMIGRVVNKTKTYYWITIGNMINPMLIAIGITYSRMLEWITVMLFLITLLGYIGYSFGLIRTTTIKIIPKLLLVVSSISLVFTMGFAVFYAIGRGWGIQTVDIPTMVLVHGIGNAFGFVLCGILGWAMINPKPRYCQTDFPVSRIYGTWKIGRTFLSDKKLIDKERVPVLGLVDDFSIYDSKEFSVRELHSEVRSFYEQTMKYRLTAETKWLRGFVWLSHIYKWISTRVEQLNLQLNSKTVQVMDGEILPVISTRDGREAVRAWMRWDNKSGKTIFVALYSHHADKERTYMNIALPLPVGNMTGILRCYNDDKDGLILTSCPDPKTRGDEGIYFMFRRLVIRLPIEESFHVFAEQKGTLNANHRMWMFGIPFLMIKYRITT